MDKLTIDAIKDYLRPRLVIGSPYDGGQIHPKESFLTELATGLYDLVQHKHSEAKNKTCDHYWRRMGETQYCEDCGISEDDLTLKGSGKISFTGNDIIDSTIVGKRFRLNDVDGKVYRIDQRGFIWVLTENGDSYDFAPESIKRAIIDDIPSKTLEEKP